jgi:DNA-binding IclR family transcriptional regulator
MGMGKSGLYKVLTSLKAKNFVIQDPSSRKYHLGPILLRMGNVYSGLIGIEKIAEPVLSHLLRILGQSVYISIWEGDRAYPACKKCPIGGVYDANDFIGKSLPIHSGASAKLLAAYQDEGRIHQLLLESDLIKRTPHTLTDIHDILQEYRQIREQAYAVEDESFSLRVFCLSVPIFGRNGSVWCCLSMAAQREAADEQRVQLWLQNLRDGAEEISTQLQLRR